MIQPISNSVNFGGTVYVGGKHYGAIKEVAEQIHKARNPKTQKVLTSTISDLKDKLAASTPKDAELSLQIFDKSNAATGKDKIQVIVKQISSTSDKEDSVLLKSKKVLIREDGKMDNSTKHIKHFCSKTAKQVASMFQNAKTQQTAGQTIDKLV